MSFAEKGVLSVFAEMRVSAGVSVPGDTIGYRLTHGGYLGFADPSVYETAMVTLEARGFIEPGDDPLSAITWKLTPRGRAFVHTLKSELPDS